jgi:GT2 family glycosyltransferase
MLPQVDVVILSWNRREPTLEAIRNAVGQRGVAVRVWVVDQGSEPDTVQALRAEAAAGRITLQELGQNRGVPVGRNLGMRAGAAPYIVCLDNDAEFDDADALLRVVSRFESDPRLGAIGFRVLNHFTGEDDWGAWVYPRALKLRSGDRFLTTRFVGAGHGIRRSALERTRGYDERLFFYWEELDLAYQIIAAGYTLVYDPEIVVRHKVSPESRTNWDDGRFYFLVRNALYLRGKYGGGALELLSMALGYQVKGWFNGWFGQPFRGAVDALRMYRSLPRAERLRLGAEARAYIHAHDRAHRGSLLTRLRREIFERIR